MSEVKQYELLESLPAYGPMYIPISETGEPFYSEGVAVRFYKKDGTAWVGNFATGSYPPDQNIFFIERMGFSFACK